MTVENLLAAIRDAASESPEPETPPILPEAAVARLKEYYDTYQIALSAPLFAPGDIVTPRGDANIRTG